MDYVSNLYWKKLKGVFFLVKRWYLLVMLLVGVGLLAGCLGPPPPPPAKLVLTPTSATVLFDGGVKQFSATYTNSNGNVVSTGFTWSVDPAEMGTINESGLFTAGSTKGQCTVICSYEGLTKQATVNVVERMSDFGELIVADTKAVWSAKFQTPIDSLQTVVNNTGTKLTEGLEFVYGPITHVGWFLNPSFLAKLFSFAPGRYTKAAILAGTPGTFYASTSPGWTVTDEDDHLTIVYKRSISGANDVVTIVITSADDSTLNYHGTVSYLTSYFTTYMDYETVHPANFSINMTIVDQHIKQSTYSGSYIFDNTTPEFTLKGNANFQFKNGEYLKYNGDWSFNLDATKEDHILGTLETSSLKLDGGMRITYAQNANVPDYNLFPATLAWTGSIKDKSVGGITLEGSYNVDIANASTYNPLAEDSSTNYLGATVSFSGSIETGANVIQGSLEAEETAYQMYAFNLTYNLTSGGVARNLTVDISNTTTDLLNYHFAVNSTWGNAAIIMDIELDSEHNLINATGQVTVDGAQVGTISDEIGWIRVDYTNGYYETF
jgi:hypothetical protein